MVESQTKIKRRNVYLFVRSGQFKSPRTCSKVNSVRAPRIVSRSRADFHHFLFSLRERQRPCTLRGSILTDISLSSDTGVTWYLFIYIPGILIRIFHTTHQLLLHYSSHREAAPGIYRRGLRHWTPAQGGKKLNYTLFIAAARCACAPLRDNETGGIWNCSERHSYIVTRSATYNFRVANVS